MLALRLLLVVLWTLLVVSVRRLFGRRGHPAWSWRLEVVAEVARYAAGLTVGVDPRRVRAALRPATLPAGLAREVEVEEVALGGLAAERHTPRGWSAGDPELLWLHGGGYVLCAPSTHRDLVARVARAVEARAWVVDYRLAPEHPIPAGLDDGHDAYRALLARGIAAERLLLGGDSAGGGMCLALMVRLRDGGEPLPAAAVLLSPWVDLEAKGATIASHERYDFLCGPLLDQYARQYVGDGDRGDPVASPLYADLRGLPPLYVQTGGAEVLRAENEQLVERARAAGVDATLDLRPGFFHVTQGFSRLLPEARKAIWDLRPFARQHLSSWRASRRSATIAGTGGSA
ncbi:MAG: alpha/beta hydrolase [Deltaproteobacteria bacterium]|nr:alpha/beta hydrolase [Deltaproteobacteria bacterium]